MKNLFHTYPPVKMEQTECSETLAYKIQTPGNYPEESIQHSEHGESLKSRIDEVICSVWIPNPCFTCFENRYTGCPRRNVPDFGRVFLMLKYTDITQNTYIQS
jgi:hypothetical protein